jgi:hypothetical protein
MERRQVDIGRMLQISTTVMHLKGKREQLCSAKNTGTRLSLTLISSMESTMISTAHILAVILKIRSWRRFVQSTKRLPKRKDP